MWGTQKKFVSTPVSGNGKSERGPQQDIQAGGKETVEGEEVDGIEADHNHSKGSEHSKSLRYEQHVTKLREKSLFIR